MSEINFGKLDGREHKLQKIEDQLNTISSTVISANSLSILLLSGSFLFYHMVQQRSLSAPALYTLSVAIILILLSAAHSIYVTVDSYAKFNHIYNNLCKNKVCSDDLLYHINKHKYFVVVVGAVFALTVTFIAYLLIRFHKI